MKRLYGEQNGALLSHCYAATSPWWEEHRLVFFAAETGSNPDADASARSEADNQKSDVKKKSMFKLQRRKKMKLIELLFEQLKKHILCLITGSLNCRLISIRKS